MKQFAEDVLRAVAAFGIGASLSALGYALLTRTSLSHDDSYVLGVAVGVVVALISLVTLICERVWKKKVALLIFSGLYALLAAYVGFVFASSELHGPGLAVLIFSAALTIGILEIAGLRRLRTLYVGSVGVPLAVGFVAMFIAVSG
jgi:hypothetical protein